MPYLLVAIVACGVSFYSASTGANNNWFYPGLVVFGALLLGLFHKHPHASDCDKQGER